MGALQDYLNKNLPKAPRTAQFIGKGVESAYGGLPGKAFLAADLVGIATADNKLKSILRTARDVALFRIIWPATLVSALAGVQAAFKHLVIDSGSLAAALDRIKTISVYQGQFEPLLKGVAAAKQRVAELFVFASKSPFSLDSVVQASRSLEIYSKGAMGAGKSLKLVENMARASGTSIEQAADAFGSLYRAVENKEPIAQASAQIQQMGLLSVQTAEKLQRLQNTGASSAEIWLSASEAIKVNSKQTDDYSKSVEGLNKQLAAQREKNKAAFGEGFIPGETQGAKLSFDTAKNLQPVMETLGSTIAAVTTTGENWSKWVAKMLTSIPGLVSVVGVLAKTFSLIATTISATAIFKGGSALIDLFKVMREGVGAASKVQLANKLMSASFSFLAKEVDATNNGHKILAKAYGSIASLTNKASTAVGGLTLSFRALAMAAVKSPLTWMAVAIAAVAGVWQLKEATSASAKALDDLSMANSEALKSGLASIKAIETEDDAYAALAKTTQDVIAAKKTLKELGPEEKAGFVEKATNFLTPILTGGIGNFTGGPRKAEPIKDIFGITDRRENRNAGREAQEFLVKVQERRSRIIQEKIASGQLEPNKEKQAVLEEAGARKVRIDQMERENKIQLATGHEKLRLMEQERVLEVGKGAEGEVAAKARAQLSGDNEALAARRGELTDKEIRKRMVANAKSSSSEIIKEEQRVREMPIGPEREKASIAVAAKRIDIEEHRTEHTEKGVALGPAIAQGVMEQKLADVRLVAEEKIAELKTVGVERAKEEYAIKQASLEETLKAQVAAGRPEEARATRAAMQSARQEQFEQTRGVEVTRAQFQLELQQHAARREGRTQESQHFEDINSFLSTFHELRSQFGEPEARKMALEKRKDELLNQSQISPVVASSLQSIGGGGGVYGVNIDPMKRVQERIRDLTESSNTILQRIEANTKEKTPATAAVPTVEEVTSTAEAVQRGMVEEPPGTEPIRTPTTANVVVPSAGTIPPNPSITNPPAAAATTTLATAQPKVIEASLSQVRAAQARTSRGIMGAKIIVPGEAPMIPPSVAITNPPIAATTTSAQAEAATAPAETARTVGAPSGAKRETIDLAGKALDYISLIAKNTGLWSVASQRGAQGTGVNGPAPETKDQRDAMIRKVHGIYGVPKFGLFPHDENQTPETPELEAPTPVAPGTGGRSVFASHTGDETVDRMLAVGAKDSSINKPAGQEAAELDALQVKSPTLPKGSKAGGALTASLDALQRKSNSLSGPSSTPYSPSPSRLQEAFADRESPEDVFASGPNFQTMQVLRKLNDIHESHLVSNDHLDTIASKEAGVQ